MAAHPSLPAIPVAPFNNGGTGAYTTDGDLQNDVGIARRILSQPRWPVTDTVRSKVVEWLVAVMEGAEDSRARVNAARGLIAADNLNLGYAKLEIEAAKDLPTQSTAVQVNVSVGGGPAFDRLSQLEALYATSGEEKQ